MIYSVPVTNPTTGETTRRDVSADNEQDAVRKASQFGIASAEGVRAVTWPGHLDPKRLDPKRLELRTDIIYSIVVGMWLFLLSVGAVALAIAIVVGMVDASGRV